VEAVPIELACLDLAGTTVADDGAVEDAFRTAVRELDVDLDAAVAKVRATMGMSKIVVFRDLLGDEAAAQEANRGFEAAYASVVAGGGAAPLPGAAEAIDALRSAGVKVCLTTGFSAATRDVVLDAVGWRDAVDLALTPEESVGGRGRPHPDMVLTAVLRLGVSDVRAVAVAGDTANDLWSGWRAGASVVAGVLTGAHDRATLAAAPHTHLLDSVAALPAVVV
jgi:phosphonatase-like hydrolase